MCQFRIMWGLKSILHISFHKSITCILVSIVMFLYQVFVCIFLRVSKKHLYLIRLVYIGDGLIRIEIRKPELNHIYLALNSYNQVIGYEYYLMFYKNDWFSHCFWGLLWSSETCCIKALSKTWCFKSIMEQDGEWSISSLSKTFHWLDFIM